MSDLLRLDKLLLGPSPATEDLNIDVLLDKIRKEWLPKDDVVSLTLAQGPVDLDRGFEFTLIKGEHQSRVSVSDGPRIREWISQKRLKCAFDLEFYDLFDGLIERYEWFDVQNEIRRDSLCAFLKSIVSLISLEFGSSFSYLKIYLPGIDLYTHGAIYAAADAKLSSEDKRVLRRLQFKPSELPPEMLAGPFYITSMKRGFIPGLESEMVKRFRQYIAALKRIKSESYHPLFSTRTKLESASALLNVHYTTSKSAREMKHVQEFLDKKLPGLGDAIRDAVQRQLDAIFLCVMSNHELNGESSLSKLYHQSFLDEGEVEFSPVHLEELLKESLDKKDQHKVHWLSGIDKLIWNCFEPSVSVALEQAMLSSVQVSHEDAVTLGGWEKQEEKYLHDALYLLPGAVEKPRDLVSVEKDAFSSVWDCRKRSTDVKLRRAVAGSVAFCHGGYYGSLREKLNGSEKYNLKQRRELHSASALLALPSG